MSASKPRPWAYRRPFVAILLALGTCASAQAEDTELFVGEAVTAPVARPNILFILDTSGSMGTLVASQEPYDPDGDYGSDYNEGRIYWKRKSQTLPPCPSTSADRDWNDDGRNDCDRSSTVVTQWVNAPRFVCDAVSGALSKAGLAVVPKVGMWNNPSGTNNDRWDVMRTNVSSEWVECAADAGVHGATSSGNLWAANKSNGPWSGSSSQKIDWNTSGEADVTFYTGHYLNWAKNSYTFRSRLEIMQEAATNLIDQLEDNVNVGLMRYSNDSSSNANGGMVMQPVKPLGAADSAVRNALKDDIEDFEAAGWTPLTETLFEAHQYMTGGNVVWGRTSDRYSGSDNSDTPSVGTACVSGNCTPVGAKYISPMTEDCQKNFIVVLTDGLPTRDIGSDGTVSPPTGIAGLIGRACDVEPNSILEEDGVGICANDLARYMFNNDLRSVAGVQSITTYWIGLDLPGGQAFLDNAAQAGGSNKAYTAANSAELTQAFTEIVSRILDETRSFTAPTVAVNAFNRTQNLNYLYMSVFKPTATYRWEGNIKKYGFTPGGEIRDLNNNPAVDATTGYFKTTARSFWSDEIDGAEAELGGAAGELTDPDPTARTVYINTSDSGALTTELVDLKDAANLELANKLLFGVTSASTVPDRPTPTIGLAGLVDWGYGYDVLDVDGDGDTTEARADMGDPLHSRPATVIYGGPAGDPDLTLYATTNDGYLHAINARTGAELWAFIPKEMLGRLEPLMLNDEVTGRGYGIDGSIDIVRIDRDNDGTIEPSNGDRVYLYFGMRRGGHHYYALDVTNRSSPSLMWRIGRADADISAGSPRELPGVGQTWSSPAVARISVNRSGGWGDNTDKMVLVFGGGYDTGQDTIAYSADGVGNRIFIVDALTGHLIWRAGPTSDSGAQLQLAKMTNSIPGEVRVVDLTGDGYADRMYAADMGGRVWRFDIVNGQAPGTLVKGGVFASLGVGDSASKPDNGNRRFFYAPDVALMSSGSATWINVAIGSGHREKPITDQSAVNRFYSLRDHHVFTQVDTSQYKSLCGTTETSPCHQIITDGDTRLVDVTSDVTPTIPAGGAGWKMNLVDVGEKILAESRTFQNKIYATSYSPQRRIPRPEYCSATVGLNRLYVVEAATGKPVNNFDTATTSPSPSDRYRELAQGSIAPEAIFVFPTPDRVPAHCSTTAGCDPTDPSTWPTDPPDDCTGDCDPSDPSTWPTVPGAAAPPFCLVGLESCGTGLANPPVRTYWERRGSD